MARRNRGGRRAMAEMNVVPYIDVMLVLLVIFMVTAPMMQTGVELNLPSADTTPIVNESGNSALIISVDESGQYFIDDSEALNLEGLSDRVNLELKGVTTRPIYIRADKEVAYGFLMQAMAVAQQAGATNIGLMADPDALK
ncbi:protein TolR [Leucothrix arctica]|uniref:Tol-Pal system protein TolR n=1 Tax=Leucothrix arctica TaxID=1481894 RepID=A0A317C7E3_9GAMM|nr:protein TolR [Leucothrix arctica]PWQ94554.1 protein TolR [Leucothrix arctica]